MDENTLRCPQCGSPVLATANYCVICGIRLPEHGQAPEDERTGWEAARSSNDPIEPIPPIEIPEFDDPVDDESTIDIEAVGGVADTYDPIPDIELDELDSFIASDTSTGFDDEAVPETDLPSESIAMVDEGGPVEAESSEMAPVSVTVASDETIAAGEWSESEESDAERVEIVAEANEMIDEGGPIDAAPHHAPSESAQPLTTADDVDADDDAAPGPMDHLVAVSIEPEDHLEKNVEAIEMIEEGGPAYGDETAPEEPAEEQLASVETSAVDDLAAAVLVDDSEPTPMISASYPESAIDGATSHAGATVEHWWPEDNDDDWTYFDGERTVINHSEVHAPSEADVPATNSEAMQRAQAIVDELRGLLPQLAGSPLPATPPDFGELRTIAIAARGQQSFDDWAALRQVVGSAVGRPADIETILQLSKRVDDVSALLVERDRLHDAFKRILGWIDEAEGNASS